MISSLISLGRVHHRHVPFFGGIAGFGGDVVEGESLVLLRVRAMSDIVGFVGVDLVDVVMLDGYCTGLVDAGLVWQCRYRGLG